MDGNDGKESMRQVWWQRDNDGNAAKKRRVNDGNDGKQSKRQLGEQ